MNVLKFKTVLFLLVIYLRCPRGYEQTNVFYQVISPRHHQVTVREIRANILITK